MTIDAPTNLRNNVMSNAAYGHSPQYTKVSVFYLAQMILCILALAAFRNFPPFVG